MTQGERERERERESKSSLHDRVINGRALLPLSTSHTIHAGFKEIVFLLHRHGANLETQSDDGSTPLLLAAATDRPEMVKLLLDIGA